MTPVAAAAAAAATGAWCEYWIHKGDLVVQCPYNHKCDTYDAKFIREGLRFNCFRCKVPWEVKDVNREVRECWVEETVMFPMPVMVPTPVMADSGRRAAGVLDLSRRGGCGLGVGVGVGVSLGSLV